MFYIVIIQSTGENLLFLAIASGKQLQNRKMSKEQ